MLTPAAALHIALLDDHALFRQGMRYILQSLPYVATVQEAATLPELLLICRNRLPDVLLLDLQMPTMDGSEVAQRLLAEFPELKIIVLSMFSGDTFVTQLMRLGARSYLPKDASPEELAEAIEQVVQTGYHTTAPMARARTRGRLPPAPHSSAVPAGFIPLTRREQEVLQLICQGHRAADIATRLFITRRTVQGHWQKLLEKTSTHNVASLVAFAVKHHLINTGL